MVSVSITGKLMAIFTTLLTVLVLSCEGSIMDKPLILPYAVIIPQGYRAHLRTSPRQTDELQVVEDQGESSDDELESTDDELESTNDELESTNDEVESTNDELESPDKDGVGEAVVFNYYNYYYKRLQQQKEKEEVVSENVEKPVSSKEDTEYEYYYYEYDDEEQPKQADKVDRVVVAPKPTHTTSEEYVAPTAYMKPRMFDMPDFYYSNSYSNTPAVDEREIPEPKKQGIPGATVVGYTGRCMKMKKVEVMPSKYHCSMYHQCDKSGMEYMVRCEGKLQWNSRVKACTLPQTSDCSRYYGKR